LTGDASRRRRTSIIDRRGAVAAVAAVSQSVSQLVGRSVGWSGRLRRLCKQRIVARTGDDVRRLLKDAMRRGVTVA